MPLQKKQCASLVYVMQTQVTAGVCMTDDIIHDALDKLRGAVTIVYPMGLPPHDPIRLEFEGNEELAGTQVIRTHNKCSLGPRSAPLRTIVTPAN